MLSHGLLLHYPTRWICFNGTQNIPPMHNSKESGTFVFSAEAPAPAPALQVMRVVVVVVVSEFRIQSSILHFKSLRHGLQFHKPTL